MKPGKGPKSLKEQLAPLQAKLKAEKNAPRPRETPPPPVKKAKRKPPPPEPERALRPEEPDLLDAEVAEFWRAAADTTPIDARGRQIQEKKKPAASPQKIALGDAVKEASEHDRATFAELLDLNEEEVARALEEKEGRPPRPHRAMEKRRVSLEGLDREGARERLERYLKAAQARKEPWVIVAFGKDPEVKWAAEGFLAQTSDLVRAVSEAREPNTARVTLVLR